MRRYDIQYFTATILDWKHLLKPDKYKNIILDSLYFLVTNERIYLYGFVITNNHIHVLWHILHPHVLQNVQRDFLKYTAQQIRFDLMAHHPKVLEMFKVNAKDRMYQFWERNPLSVPIWSEDVLLQKLHYIHENPVRADLCERAEDYFYSSARFYMENDNSFSFLRSYLD